MIDRGLLFDYVVLVVVLFGVFFVDGILVDGIEVFGQYFVFVQFGLCGV